MTIQEVFDRIQEKKKKLKERVDSFRDALRTHSRYSDILEEMERLRIEKKQIEATVMTPDEKQEVEGMRIDIKTDKILLTDLSLNHYVQGDQVEAVDKYAQKYGPEFSVKFTKK